MIMENYYIDPNDGAQRKNHNCKLTGLCIGR